MLLDGRGFGVSGGDTHPLGGPDRAAPAHVVVAGFQLEVTRDHQTVVAADRRVDVRALLADPSVDLAVVVARHDLDLEVDRAADALDHAQDLRAGPGGSVPRHRHAVGDHRLPALDPEAGFEHHRVAAIAAVDVRLRALHRDDREVAAALPVEQPAEAAARVEARQAAPVDRAPARDQGGRLAVAD